MECSLLRPTVLVLCLATLELLFELCDDVPAGGASAAAVVRSAGLCSGLKLLGHKRFKVSCDTWRNDSSPEGGSAPP